jgi:alpha-mannosidase
MKEKYPSIYQGAKAAILAGRIEVQGGFWVECDSNLSGGESLIRQAVYGRRFIEEEFGRDMKICWLPDAFGFSAALPQIIRGCGMEYFSTIKLAWNRVNVFPRRTFWWQGIDGSRVLVHMPPEGDYNSKAQPGNLLDAIKKYPEKHLGKGLLVYGGGDGGGGPDENHLELLERQKNLAGLPKVTQSSALDFFEALKSLDVQDVYQGELYLEAHQGTYTTQAKNKYYNRLCETLLHNAEVLSVFAAGSFAGSSGIPYPRAALDEIWRELLLYQFHDIIPGSAITRVNREAVAGYEKMEERLRTLIADALAAIGTEGRRNVTGHSVMVNLTSFTRDEYVRQNGINGLPDAWFHAHIPPYAAAVAEAAPGPFPALAYSDGTAGAADFLTNGLLTLRFGAHGEIVSCTDAAGRELAAGGLNHLVLFRDKFEIPFNAWDIDPKYRSRRKRRLRPYAHHGEIDGPQVVRTNRYRFGKSSLVQRIILREGSDTVRFETEVEWHEKLKMLRAEFFPTDYGPTVKGEIQFGHIVRSTTEKDSVEKAQFEICAHRWAAVEKDGRGFALLNDSKYGYRAKQGLISLNLLRSPIFPDKEADRGKQQFTYAFCPFESGDFGKVIREGYCLNNPLIAVDCGGFDSLVRLSDMCVIAETIKAAEHPAKLPAENSNGVVLRLYESLGKEAVVSVSTRIPHNAVYAADMLENRQERTSLEGLRFRPFEVKTLVQE